MRVAHAGLWLVFLLFAAMPAAALSFVDGAHEAGLEWVHASNYRSPNYPETTGSGACWGDIDGDGIDDLYLPNGLFAEAPANDALDPRSALYLNRGDGRLTDASAEWHADIAGWAQGCTLVDPDADGDLDLLVTGYDVLLLLENNGVFFVDATPGSGLSFAGNCDGHPHCYGVAASWADYDGDLDLDVYVTQYVAYDIDAGGPVSPSAYDGMSNLLFRNRLVEDGVAVFEDVTDIAGVRDDPGPFRSKSFQSVWADCDADGDPDLYVASDLTANTLFRNNGDGTFTDVAAAAGVADTRAGMGLLFQDMDHDGDPDLYMTHYQLEHNGFYLNNGDCTFTDHSGELGLATDWDDVGWGTGVFDFDNDGRTDVFAVNGHTLTTYQFYQEPRIWRGLPNGTFEDVSDAAGPAFDVPSVGRGAAVSDHDLDGDLDIVLVDNANETVRLLRNDSPIGNFLQVEPRQGGPNPLAVGAEITVRPLGGTPYTRIAQAGNSYLGQHSLVVHAGLGAATLADVDVRWPDGATETWTDLAAGERARLLRGVPQPVLDAVSPLTEILVDGAPPATGWYPGPVTVAMVAHDRAVGTPSGVTAIEIDTGAGWVPYDGPVTFTAEGLHTFRGRATDAAGNVEPPRTFRVGIDTVAPATTPAIHGAIGAGGWYHDRATLHLDALDDAAGIAEVWHRVNGGAWTLGDRVPLNTSAVHRIEHRAVDRAGNVEPWNVVEVPVDADPPTIRLEGHRIILGVGHTEFTATASDRTSGIRAVAFFLDDEDEPHFVDTDGSDGWAWQTSGPSGAFRLTAVALDGADHVDSDESYTIHAGSPTVWLPLGLLPALLVAGRRH